MGKKDFRIVSLLVIVSLVALMVVQIYSLAQTYNGMNEQFAQKVKSAMERAAYDEIVTRSSQDNLSSMISAFPDDSVRIPLKDIPPDSIRSVSVTNIPNGEKTISLESKNKNRKMYIVQLRYNYHKDFRLAGYDSLLRKNLDDAGIESAYELQLRKQTGNNVNIDLLHKEVANPFTISIFLDSEGKTVCTVNIENPNRGFLKDMRWIITSSVLILFLLGFSFWYLLRTLFRQKTLEEMRNDFTHNITHELKTPIAVAYAANDAMLNFSADKNPAKREEYLTVVRDQLNALSDMVQRILSLSTLEREDFSLSLSDCRLDGLLEGITASIALKYSKKIVFSISIEPADLSLRVDQFHFSTVLNNILDNAVKYSGESVEVNVSAKAIGEDSGGRGNAVAKDGKASSKEGETVAKDGNAVSKDGTAMAKNRNTAGNCVEIRIKDNGIGISSSDCRRIFDKFYRVPTGNLHDVKGSGLGLYFARLIVEKHGGSISVSSSLGKGTEFRICMPI